MGSTPRRTAVVLASLFVIVALPASAWAASTQTLAKRGAAYLVTQQKSNGSIPAFSNVGSTADAILAFQAAAVGGRAETAAIGFLKAKTQAGKVTTLGLESKVVLALDAAGKDPGAFGGHDLVGQIESTLAPNGRYGTDPLLEDALAVLAVVSAGDTVPTKASTWLIDGQCPDGGWAYDEPYNPSTDDAHCNSGSSDFYNSDSNTTSYVVQALEATGHTGWAVSPFSFFDTVRDAVHGGWSYDQSFVSTDANSTALVLQAYAAAHVAVPKGALAALRDLQYQSCGAWAYTWSETSPGPPDVGATIGAIPGLLLAPLPIAHTAITQGTPTVPSC